MPRGPDTQYDAVVQDRFTQLGMSDRPDHEKAGYPQDCFEQRKQGFRELLGAAVRTLQAQRPGGRPLRALDVGCCNGVVCELVHPLGPFTYGVDVSAPLIQEARRRCPPVHFAIGSCYALPFPDAAFDLVTCLGVLPIVAQWRRCVAELVRVCAPGGIGFLEFLTDFTVLDAAVRVPWYLLTRQFDELVKLRRWLRADYRRTTGRGFSIVRRPREVVQALAACGVRQTRLLSRRWGCLNATNSLLRFEL
jgi:SAM-dependent methyltransferase